MADGVDAAVEAVKATGFETPVDLAPREPERKQLPARHHAVLRAGEFADLAVTWTLFFIHMLV